MRRKNREVWTRLWQGLMKALSLVFSDGAVFGNNDHKKRNHPCRTVRVMPRSSNQHSAGSLLLQSSSRPAKRFPNKYLWPPPRPTVNYFMSLESNYVLWTLSFLISNVFYFRVLAGCHEVPADWWVKNNSGLIWLCSLYSLAEHLN